MILNTKLPIVLLALFFVIQTYGQDETQAEKSEYTFKKDDHYGIVTFGFTRPIPIGDNFAQKSFRGSFGFDFNIMTNLFSSPWLIGFQYSVGYNGIENTSLVGNYSHSNVGIIGGLVGYQFYPREKIRFNLKAGVGAVYYRNSVKGGIGFSDSGTGVNLIPELSYHFTKNIGLFFASEFRKDFLKIKAPKEIEDQFKSVNYIKPIFGLRVLF